MNCTIYVVKTKARSAVRSTHGLSAPAKSRCSHDIANTNINEAKNPFRHSDINVRTCVKLKLLL